VLVPGIADFADDYVEACSAFTGRRLLIVEMRGRGGSDAPETGYTPEEQAGDVAAVLDAAGVDRFHLMTFSRGTTPGLLLAFQMAARVLTVSIGDYLPGEIGLSPEFVDHQWSSRWRGRPMPERVPRHVLDGIQVASRAREFWAELAGLGAPVLVARSAEGGLINDPQERRYRDEVPGVEVVVVPGTGHDLFRSSRTAYPEAVLEFIGRRRPGT
jgi:pimeloyl-ACP methyl ester carboxylesterase